MSSKRTERQMERKELNRLRSKEIERGLFRMQICIYSGDKHEHVAKNITYVDSGCRLPLTQLSVELTQRLNREVKSITQLKRTRDGINEMLLRSHREPKMQKRKHAETGLTTVQNKQ